jgi:hypothetical protein
MILVSHVEHVLATAQLVLSLREMDSSISMLIHVSLVVLALATAQLEL